MTVGPGAVLAGHGGVTDIFNTQGGTVAPGGTIGTLTAGSYAQSATSTLLIEVSPTTASKLVASTIHLNGTLSLVFDPGVYTAHTYDIVHAVGSTITGTFRGRPASRLRGSQHPPSIPRLMSISCLARPQ